MGVCAVDVQTGQFLDFWHYDFKNFDGDLFDKTLAFEKIHDMVMDKKQLQVVGIAVEDFAKKFSGGASSIGTILTLARFNGMVCLHLSKRHGLKPHMLNVRSARSSVGIKIDKDSSLDTKDQIVQQVMQQIPDATWEYHTISRGPRKGESVLSTINQDRADAYIIAKAYYNAISNASKKALKKR